MKLRSPLTHWIGLGICLCAFQVTRAGVCDFSWQRVTFPESANSPGRLIGQAAAFDSQRGVAVLFGGNNPLSGLLYTDETWEWQNSVWVKRPVAVHPFKRADAAMAYDTARGVCVLFGGGTNIFANELPFNDTWEWNGTTWNLRLGHDPAANNRPPPLDYPVMAYDRHRKRTVLLGLSERTGGQINPSTRTWEWDGTNWTAFLTAPTPRAAGAMAFDPVRKLIVLFGGNSAGAGILNDTWTWNGNVWTLAATGGPSPREEHAMAFDERRQVLVLFGGRDSSITDLAADTWEWNGVTWTLQPQAGIFGLIGRRLHHLWYEPDQQRLVVFGGTYSTQNPNGSFNHYILDDVFEGRPPGRWVDFLYPGLPSLPENGWFNEPYNSLAEAIQAAPNGCTLHLKTGTTPETITILKPLTLQTYNGPVTIGGQ